MGAEMLAVCQRTDWPSLVRGQFVDLYQNVKPHTLWLSILFRGHILACMCVCMYVCAKYTQGGSLKVLIIRGKDREYFNCKPAGDWLYNIIPRMGYYHSWKGIRQVFMN